ncbi:MAG: carbon-nitrogen hydrolase [Ignavibacteria bacterium]|jgi:predicted amidohydrolase|nr:carbon-nitrogen hydrolase [Ignavibacteria bacterium]
MIDISIVQFCPKLFDKKSNINKIEQFIEADKSDLIVFPELATTGYSFITAKEAEEHSDEFNGKIMKRFQEMATRKNKIIVLGFAEKFRTEFYNSAAILFPEKEYSACYRKTHLFYRERFCFSEGNTGFFVVDYKPFDLKLGTMICYDWRFPEAARTLGIKGADIIACPSNLVTNIWHLAMPARAIENKVFLAVANRYGTEEREGQELFFNGDSALWSYNGTLLAVAQKEGDEVLKSSIDPKLTRNKAFNEYNDIFKDRRSNYYA